MFLFNREKKNPLFILYFFDCLRVKIFEFRRARWHQASGLHNNFSQEKQWKVVIKSSLHSPPNMFIIFTPKSDAAVKEALLWGKKWQASMSFFEGTFINQSELNVCQQVCLNRIDIPLHQIWALVSRWTSSPHKNYRSLQSQWLYHHDFHRNMAEWRHSE